MLAQGADTLVSIGGYQSNHTRQVAAVAAHLGLKCRLVQEKWVDWDDPVNDKVGNILLSRIMGADVRLDPSGFDIGIRHVVGGRARRGRGGRRQAVRASRPAPPSTRSAGSASPTGPSRSPQQEQELGVFFDTIVVCTVTGSTHAGMIAGFAALRTPAAARAGCSASTPPRRSTRPATRCARIARHTAELIELGRDLRDDEITVLEGWAGDLYGIPVESTVEAIRLSGRLEGMIIDPVYEGKSMAGLIDLVTSGEIAEDSTVLYAHLGGQPALNAYSRHLRLSILSTHSSRLLNELDRRVAAKRRSTF